MGNKQIGYAVIGACACLWAQAALAADGAAGGVAVAGQLAQAQAQAALLRAQLEIAKIKAEIRKADSDGAQTAPATPPMGGAGFTPPALPALPALSAPLSAAAPAPAETRPRILALMGRDRVFTATLLLPNGAVMRARAGSVLPGGWKVLRVDAAGVTAVHEGKTVPLAFAGNGAQGG